MGRDRLADLQAEQSDDEDVQIRDTQVPIEGWQFGIENFLKEIEALWDLIKTLKSQIKEVKSKHNVIICAPHNDEKTKQELEELGNEITKNSNTIRANLKALEPKREANEKMTADLRMRIIQHTSLSKTFVDVMTEYNEIQIEFRDKCKERIKRQLEITGRVTTNEELEEMLERGNLAVFTEGIIMETQQARQTLADIEARHSDIIKLENSIRELHGMFTDMALLIENQGELINRVEHLVNTTAAHVEAGREKLRAATQYQSKARKKKIIIISIIIVIITIAIIVLAIYLAPSSSNSSGNSSQTSQPTSNNTS